jgi:peroxiredoxin
MIELGQLEKHHADFDGKNIRLVVSSIEGPDDAKETQKQFPHLVVVSDEKRSLSNAVEVMDTNKVPHESSAPTTLIVDGSGVVRWIYRSGHVMSRLSPSELLAQAEKSTGKSASAN